MSIKAFMLTKFYPCQGLNLTRWKLTGRLYWSVQPSSKKKMKHVSRAAKFNFFDFLRVRGENCRRYGSSYPSSNQIRTRFIDYFLTKDHQFIRSSSVHPYNDPTLEFVNAGMNQFKNIFLNTVQPPVPRAVNSQKCIRIGGKHNDLNVVGYDSYHHTFFEMLGNWSFGDYFKKEACEMAWDLITTQPYSLSAERLYVTYFGGNSRLKLNPDLETKQIWESIGVSPERIIPFGMKDNFWEMASTGPCGPCTEIHYDHSGTSPRPQSVNKDLPDLTELWNIVFIQYDRQENGSLIPLEKSFVDTGMGFERLVALLQRKTSNYDTDLFSPIFKTISEYSGIRTYTGLFGDQDADGLDAAYRILADHSRMITVSVADFILPELNHGLRRVIRKALMAAEQLAPKDPIGLLCQTCFKVVEILEDTYPELRVNSEHIDLLLKDEESIWQNIRDSSKSEWKKLLILNPNLSKLSDSISPGLIGACRELNYYDITSGETVPRKLALTMYDRHGVSVELIEELMHLRGIKIDLDLLRKDIDSLRESHKSSMMVNSSQLSRPVLRSLSENFYPTDDSSKFSCTREEDGNYTFDDCSCEVLALISAGQSVPDGAVVSSGSSVGLIFDKTNCWASNKGGGDLASVQLFDQEAQVAELRINEIQNHSGFIVHYGTITSSIGEPVIKFGDWKALIAVNKDRRMAIMRNTTASHLLSHVIRTKYVRTIQSFSNSETFFTTKYSLFGQNISSKDFYDFEKTINAIISEGANVEVTTVSVQEMLSMSDVVIPPFVTFQQGQVQVVTTSYGRLVTREVSIGPNVKNTRDIEEFCLVGFDLGERGRSCTVSGVTGKFALSASDNFVRVKNYLDSLVKKPGSVELELKKAQQMVNTEIIPIKFKQALSTQLHELTLKAKEKLYKEQEEGLVETILRAKDEGNKFLIYYAGENAKLDRLTKLCPDLPILIFAYNKGHFTARCSSPRNSPLTADQWINEVSKVVGSTSVSLKGVDSRLMCGLKPIKISSKKLKLLKDKAQFRATQIGISTLQMKQ